MLVKLSLLGNDAEGPEILPSIAFLPRLSPIWRSMTALLRALKIRVYSQPSKDEQPKAIPQKSKLKSLLGVLQGTVRVLVLSGSQRGGFAARQKPSRDHR